MTMKSIEAKVVVLGSQGNLFLFYVIFDLSSESLVKLLFFNTTGLR